MLAADSYLQIFARTASQLRGHLDQLTDAFLIEYRERIGFEDLRRFVILLESRIVVARKSHRGLRKIVGTEREEFRLLRDAIGGQRRARDFDHGSDHVFDRVARLLEHFGGYAIHNRLLVVELLHTANQRDHDFGEDFHTLLLHLYGSFENGAGLHFGDLGIGHAETASAMAQHRVEFVKILHTTQQWR